MLGLTDNHGRTARDLRVSLTDRCNLRCTYCMPAEGMPWTPRAELLTDDEIVRLIRVAVERLGVTKVRFTGGEPLLRPGLVGIVAAVKAMRTDEGAPPELALTTNGVGLADRVDALAEAGLDRVNISLDSLDHNRYRRLARRDRLDDVLRAIDAAARAGLRPVKLNTVVMRGINEVDVVPLVEFALARGHELRFIEQMPLGPHGRWDADEMVTADELLAMLRARFTLTPADAARGAAPAEAWDVAPSDGLPGGRIGVIASVTQPFCDACDRTRLTSDGQVRTCLFSRVETDLRAPLRDGASDDELARRWAGAQAAKPPHHGIGEADFVQPGRGMSAIGG
ncbi:GTP 3',8-cyclase MoaA [uncultured Tessaracoccus sp.]|uniref:GTP 3',8-cyclase MoaA n=1 Tax=uncultured Tessaracoccus sp. TaxID=905023 RepID=UPI0025D9647A|nr:GTP 3',8-cyclase MoaA [uncultured Tessaracoccus sp.]